MSQNIKWEYEPPQIKQLSVNVEEGYALSSQAPAVTGDNAIHFDIINGAWE